MASHGPIQAGRPRDNLLSRSDVEGQIAAGHILFVVHDRVIRADGWIDAHPGGRLAIEHMVGRDATDEVNALHGAEALKRMALFQIGRITLPWVNFVPPIQGGSFRTTSEQLAERCPNVSVSSPESDDCKASPVSVGSAVDMLCQSSGLLRSRRGSASSSSITLASTGSFEKERLAEERTGFGHINHKTGKLLEIDSYVYPSLDPDVQAKIVEKYRILHQTLLDKGLFNCNYWAYAIEICRYSLLVALSITALRYGWYITSGLFLGAFWHQLVFSAHDAGHMGITHDYQTDTMIGIIIADCLGGLSIGWWKRSHNVHHIVTNSPEHDPDIQHLPFFAISERFLHSVWSTYSKRWIKYDWLAKLAIPHQHRLYHFLLMFGRFNLYVLSWVYVFKGPHPKRGVARYHHVYEMVGMTFFWFWFGYLILYRSVPTNWGRFCYIMSSHMITAPLHLQITLSHFAMSTKEAGPDESFVQRMLRTTMDVDCPTWLDFFHGGLQFQAIHHMYPRMPRHNLRGAQKLVQEFCDEVGIPYALYGFVDGNKAVLGRLSEVGRQASLLAKCQAVVVGEENEKGEKIVPKWLDVKE